MGFMGPFSGRLGTAVGYMWNGKCCMRAYQRFVHNPRTEAQQAQRNIFKQEVQLASHLRWVLGKTLTEQARGEGLTAYNLFVRDNQHAFALSEGRLAVDYATLRLSMGDVPCVVPTTAVCDDDNVLTVKFERGTGAALDGVYLYVYVPDLENGFLSMPVFRREKSIRLLLPDQYRGHEMHAWLMVERCDGSWSESCYCGTVGAEMPAIPEVGIFAGGTPAHPNAGETPAHPEREIFAGGTPAHPESGIFAGETPALPERGDSTIFAGETPAHPERGIFAGETPALPEAGGGAQRNAYVKGLI